ncbi:hypothetical protein AUR04nite_34690 [Glutamicibacter uratoxydans]|uniref:Uncharacterized protein n=1 Tax=Glutamicibacter uratoxydans TaxID=43667 RepID=A0A4Y4DTH9_GLUUR|nr:hypothetical protein AUR04nite_34690 [Glutamicibacter uratoxydans]
MKGDALGRLGADARQPTELVDQFLYSTFVHVRPLSSFGFVIAWSTAFAANVHTSVSPRQFELQGAGSQAALELHDIAVHIALFDDHAAQQALDSGDADER